MVNVEKYISDLLHFHDCVIVPGLGGFVANYKSASIVHERNLFLPPSKEIGFNRSLSHSDGLLIDFISRREAISYADASAMVSRFATNVHQRVAVGEVIDLGEVGLLRKDAIGNLQFTPKEGTSFLPEAFGLDSFRFEPMEQKRMVRIDVQAHVPRLLRSRSPRYWAAAAAIIAGLFIFNTEVKMPTITQAGMDVFVSTPVIVVDENNSEDLSLEVTTDVADSPAPVESMEQTYKAPVVDLPKYHIVAASFKQSVPANQALDAFLTEGYSDARLIENGQGRIRVSIASFVEKEEALSALNEYRQNPRFEGVWILTSK
jgi:hypothetical protein